MRKLVSSLLGCALLCAAQEPGASPADAKPARIEGEVRDALTLAPMERAHVVVRRMVNGRFERYGALTSADGKFAIERISAPPNGGGFEIKLDRTGYVDLTPPSQSELRISAGESKTGLKLKLTPAASITGRVRDSEGAAVEGISVAALNGTRTQASSATDDRGVFRISGLAPGKYRLVARPLNLPTPPEIRTDGTAEIHHSPTFFPGELDAKNATRVETQPGAEVTGVEIKLVRTPILRVSGKVSGVPAGAQNVAVSLVRVDGISAGAGPVRPDGSFEIWRVDPGKYTATASHYNSSAGTQWRSAPIDVQIAMNDVEGLSLQLFAPLEIRGTSVFEDEEARTGPQASRPQTAGQSTGSPQPPSAPPMKYVMLREIATGNNLASSQLEDDGTFTLTRVNPNRYRVVVAPPRMYVRSMEFGQTQLDGAELDLRSGAAAPLTVHLATAAATLSGVVRDKDGPAAGLRVFLVEAGQRQPNPRITLSSAGGAYSFKNLAPGKYRLVASDESESSLMLNDEELEGIAETIEITDQQNLTRDVKKFESPGRR
jgi:hypothetical protein